jgi:hypothetical protein
MYHGQLGSNDCSKRSDRAGDRPHRKHTFPKTLAERPAHTPDFFSVLVGTFSFPKEPLATIVLFLRTIFRAGLALWFGRSLIPLNVRVAASRAAHDAIGPAHLLDVLEALFLCGKLYVDLADVTGFGCFRCAMLHFLKCSSPRSSAHIKIPMAIIATQAHFGIGLAFLVDFHVA